jgi:uncharacterized protein YjbI with pentapeptide repeats
MSIRARDILLLSIVLVFLGLLWAGYTTEPDSPIAKTIGFRGRSVWDWIAIGLVGAAVAVVGWRYAQWQREREAAATLEQEQDAALNAYLGQMSNLMIDQQLGKEAKNEDFLQAQVRKVAQARTIAVLLGLDKDHKRRPLTLVYKLGLLDKPDPVLELENAGLDGANLRELTLHDACLNGADLRHADLHGADLEGSNLSQADLRGANLTRADLSRVDLRNANLLPYDEKNPTTWNKHNLEKRGTLNSGDSFSRKGLTVTNLSKATLREAQLGDAWLGGADLSDADLTDADLRDAKVTKEQLEQVKSLEGATMPNGQKVPKADPDRMVSQKYEDWLKSKGLPTIKGYNPKALREHCT